MGTLPRIAVGCIACLTGTGAVWANERLNSAHEYFSSKTFSTTWIWVGAGIIVLAGAWWLYKYLGKKE